MFEYFAYAYLEACTMPTRIATAAFVEFWGGSSELSDTVTFSRRSTAQLTIVSSNSWVRSHRSKANLRLVKA